MPYDRGRELEIQDLERYLRESYHIEDRWVEEARLERLKREQEE